MTEELKSIRTSKAKVKKSNPYLPCPYCDMRLLLRADWKCPHCKLHEGKARFLWEKCRHCKRLTETAFCEHCNQEFKV